MDEFTNVRPPNPVEPPPELPERMKRLPWSQLHNAPIPWFVTVVGGEPDFRIVQTKRMLEAIQKRLCWICGDHLGKFMAFTIGPMCAINRISSEPPSHRDCAIYAARTCPFLANPNRKRRGNDMPEGSEPGPGVMITRNPGVALVWVTLGYRARIEGEQQNKILFEVGDPVALFWYAEGQRATRVEVEAAINSGLPVLQDEASKEGPESMAALASAIDRARLLLQTV